MSEQSRSSHRYNPFVAADVEAALGGRYTVAEQIALGGQGAVFQATRTSRPDGESTSDKVALKLHLFPSQDIRVTREITAMEQISHPALARLIEHGYCDVAGKHTRYIAWEFVEGEPLSRRLKSGPLLESEVLKIGSDVSTAIATIWAQRIVHGDVKPSNIMLRESGGAVLIDLGSARHVDVDNSPAARRPIGTIGYFSPEQARGEKLLTCASDVFSLGVVLLQCLLGHHPTNYQQTALSTGFRASGGRIAASTGLLCALDKMLSERPNFRQNPDSLCTYFKKLQQRMDEDFESSGRTYQPAPGL